MHQSAPLPLSPAVLLQVEVEKTAYEAEFGGEVVLACRFHPASNPQQKLEVQWHWVKHGPARVVYRLEAQTGKADSQSPHYQGRVTLLREQLREGWIKLKVRERERDRKKVMW